MLGLGLQLGGGPPCCGCVTQRWWYCIGGYTLWGKKKLHAFYFLNNFVKSCPILIFLVHRYPNYFATKQWQNSPPLLMNVITLTLCFKNIDSQSNHLTWYYAHDICEIKVYCGKNVCDKQICTTVEKLRSFDEISPIHRVPTCPGKSWTLRKIFLAWKVIENNCGHGKSWKSTSRLWNFLTEGCLLY